MTEATWNRIQGSTQPETESDLCPQQAPLQTCLRVTTDLEVSSWSSPKMIPATDLTPRMMQGAAASRISPVPRPEGAVTTDTQNPGRWQ
jgi:hypothetical protein